MMEKIISYIFSIITIVVIAILPPFRQAFPGLDNDVFRKIFPGKMSFLFRIPMGDVQKDGIALPLFVEQLVWYLLALVIFAIDLTLLITIPDVLWYAPVFTAAMLVLQIAELFVSTALIKRAQRRRGSKM